MFSYLEPCFGLVKMTLILWNASVSHLPAPLAVAVIGVDNSIREHPKKIIILFKKNKNKKKKAGDQ